jgi:hypothetical protein
VQSRFDFYSYFNSVLYFIFSILLQRSIHISNGRYRLRNAKKKAAVITNRKNCIYFNRFGKCHRGDKCPFVHDRTRIAVCTQYVNE